MDWVKIAASAVSALAVGGGVGGVVGYDKRDSETAEALERARCKIADLKQPAAACGWERPEDWCALREEQ